MFFGIFVRDDAHANIHDNHVLDIRDQAIGPLSGAQRGIGVLVGSGSLAVTSATADLTNNVIARYQKGGVVADGAATQMDAVLNTMPVGIKFGNGDRKPSLKRNFAQDRSRRGVVTNSTLGSGPAGHCGLSMGSMSLDQPC